MTKPKPPKKKWHTVEITTAIRLRHAGAVPKLPSGTQKIVRQLLEEFTKEDLAAMIATGIEGFSWEED